MKYLLIDTSTNIMIIMLHVDGKLKGIKQRKAKSDHQAYIIPLIDELLKEHNLNIKDIDTFIVGIGPGSYTGLRVSVMTAKMFSYTLKLNLMKVSSLLFLTSGYKEEVLAWHDARNNQGFSGFYLKGKLLDEEKVRHLNDLNGLEKEKLIILNEDTIKLDSNVIIKMSTLVEDVYNLVPNYLRKTKAELNLDQKS
ncbi:MAG: tRNA (adenosine(37)-N6)-threonylcarbamoyltransferase complex dimerization subunit type 1 TsaB [Acholeplasmataceae bacterium]